MLTALRRLFPRTPWRLVPQMPGRCIDAADVTIGTYSRNPELLALEADGVEVQETLHSHLFRSLCPVTGQPDWASVSIEYSVAPRAYTSDKTPTSLVAPFACSGDM